MIKLTKRQKLDLEIALAKYRYIQTEYELSHNDSDFQDVYYEFYLKNGIRFDKNNEDIKQYYFNKLFSLKANENVKTLLLEFKQKFGGKYKLSILSKLVHTVRPETPIYDSNVSNYLQKKYDGKKIILLDTKIKNLFIRNLEAWKRLNKHYKDFMKGNQAKEWIDYFNKHFSDYSDINDIKKIDFIMYILGAEK